jgi:hypothetical protein
MLRQAVVVAALIASAAALYGNPPVVGGPIPVQIFPPGNWWNLDISAAPVDPNSANFLTEIGTAKRVRGDFDPSAGAGYPYIIVDSTEQKKIVTFGSPDQSDGVGAAFYPIPDAAINSTGWIQNLDPGSVDDRDTLDRDMLIVDKSASALYELSQVWYNGTSWVATTGAFFDMTRSDPRTNDVISAQGSGLAILPGLVRYDEATAATPIRHAFRVTLLHVNGRVAPATATPGIATAGAPPFGARLRLKASKDITSFSPEGQRVLQAMKTYGLIVSDRDSDMFVSGSYDAQWGTATGIAVQTAMASLSVSDFEVVKLGWPPPPFVITPPGLVGSGEAFNLTVTVHDTNDNIATAYTGRIHFDSSDVSATLPADYTFTASDAGAHTFQATLRVDGLQTITVTDVADVSRIATVGIPVGPGTPTNLVAAGTTQPRVDLTWTASAHADHYEIYRADTAPIFAFKGSTSASSYSDTTVSADAVYVYEIRAFDSAAQYGPMSVPDVANTIAFTDDLGAPSTTLLKANHLTEVQTAANKLRKIAGLSDFPFATPLGKVLAQNILDVRAALDEARSVLHLPNDGYTDSAIDNHTPVRAVHIKDLRDGVK